MIVEDKEIVVSGSFPRIARLRAEFYEWLEEPHNFIRQLKNSYVKADLFTFLKRAEDEKTAYEYHLEWEPIAVLPITSYDHWWKKQINDKTRNMVRKASKCGVEIKEIPFTDDLVKGIQIIYNESPLRQGKPFLHYKKDFETLKRNHVSYLDRSDFIGAFYDNNLIGFIKLVHDEGMSHLMQIISLIAHRDKAPTNALIARAVEICSNRRVPYLHYGVWSKRGLGDFKRHHAFEQLDLPRYFVPLTLKGVMTLKLKVHQKLSQRLPEELIDILKKMQSRWNSLKCRI